MNKYIRALMDGMRQWVKKAPRGYFARIRGTYRWLSRVTSETLEEKKSRGEHSPNRSALQLPTKQRRGVYVDPPVWHGPPTNLPEHIRRHGIKLQDYGIDRAVAINASLRHAAQSTQPGEDESQNELRTALARLQDQITTLERRQDTHERELAQLMASHSSPNN